MDHPSIDALLGLPPYGLDAEAKRAALLPAVAEAMVYHYEHCAPFQKWCQKQNFRPQDGIHDLESVPFLPL